jgi:GDPmannose 4,6-dehydratase
MKQKCALITGITGQDGGYLAEFLLSKGYKVYGTYRRSSTPNFWRLDALGIKDKINKVTMELSDSSSIQQAMLEIKPDEVYNLAAQSFVPTSFTQPLYTGDLDGLSVTRILNVLRDFLPETRYYQASTSEMFGRVQEIPQTEKTPFYPRSPYGVAKLYGHWITINYQEAYNLFTCSGILFNHESPLRGLEFVTRKITSSLASIRGGKQSQLTIGNLEAKRDWGFAGDYVKGMWTMLQQDKPDNYVLATGVTTSIRSFIEIAANTLDTKIVWEGEGIDEIGIEQKTGKILVRVSKQYYRPAEVDLLIGDAAKAKTKLSWNAETKLEKLVEMMVKADVSRAESSNGIIG